MPVRSEGHTPRATDAVTLGAHSRIARPAPHGIEDLGRRLVEAQGGVDAALGALALWLFLLEERDR